MTKPRFFTVPLAAVLRGTVLLAAMLIAGLPAASPASAADKTADRGKIQHILVIYLENHSFDNLFGKFPGANGLANAGAAAVQVDDAGLPYKVLPPVIEVEHHREEVDPRFPAELPNEPFPIDKYVPIDQMTGDLVHRFYDQQMQIDGGKMDKFVLYSDAKALSLGYYDISNTSIWKLAKDYTLADNFFHGAFGGSFLNHQWLICECAPKFPNAPEDIRAVIGKDGKLEKNGSVTPKGYAVNTLFSVYEPHPASVNPEKLVPPQDQKTIGDQLTEKGIDWAWYSGGFDDALAGHPDPLFQYHHQPFVYYRNFGDDNAATRAQKKAHLRDEAALLAGVARGELPPVAFWKPIGAENQHPGYAELVEGDRKVAAVIDKIKASALWKDTVIVITYDENGGYWDHVKPPKLDAWGPGVRVPAIIVSSLAKKGYVDHTLYDTTSILKLIHERFGLKPLGPREAQVGDLTNALEF